MALHKHVDVRQGSSHPPREWGVSGRGFERVDPHDPMRNTRKAPHLRVHNLWVAPVPPVGADHHDRPPRHSPHPPALIELSQALAEACAA